MSQNETRMGDRRNTGAQNYELLECIRLQDDPEDNIKTDRK